MPTAAGVRSGRVWRREKRAGDTAWVPVLTGRALVRRLWCKPRSTRPQSRTVSNTRPLAGPHACLAQRSGYAIPATYAGVVMAVVTETVQNALTSP